MKISDLTEKLEDVCFQLKCIKDESSDKNEVDLKSEFAIGIVNSILTELKDEVFKYAKLKRMTITFEE